MCLKQNTADLGEHTPIKNTPDGNNTWLEPSPASYQIIFWHGWRTGSLGQFPLISLIMLILRCRKYAPEPQRATELEFVCGSMPALQPSGSFQSFRIFTSLYQSLGFSHLPLRAFSFSSRQNDSGKPPSPLHLFTFSFCCSFISLSAWWMIKCRRTQA